MYLDVVLTVMKAMAISYRYTRPVSLDRKQREHKKRVHYVREHKKRVHYVREHKKRVHYVRGSLSSCIHNLSGFAREAGLL